ncbi:hypothetical protein BV898_11295 [Hypsibius exemplaris]|uniref:ZSWIM1/3 RNaseH-like domain-containing protein n=1 Tax=Hypsibius exemplaris TaxID=2072580 RepID=A0A1W0WH45_HYPEX|nr:hypothetical protein BV898_11295 [Hypsibius exemplaris]
MAKSLSSRTLITILFRLSVFTTFRLLNGDGKTSQNWEEFEQFRDEWCRKTGLVFRVGKRSKKVNQLTESAVYDTLRYSIYQFCCVHYGEPEKLKIVPSVRPNQTSARTGCRVFYEVKGWKRLNLIQVTIGEREIEHSGHSLDPQLVGFYPAKRKASDEEKDRAADLHLSGANATSIRNTINEVRKATGRQGTLITKDVHNLVTKLKTDRRKGASEADVTFALLNKLKADHPGGNVQWKTTPRLNATSGEMVDVLTCVFIQTAGMIKLLKECGEVLFMDGTYRVNIERYYLWSCVVMDKYGTGQCVALAFLENETDQNMRQFFNLLHESVTDITKVLFVDKDLKNLRTLDEVFKLLSVLICTFHAFKAVKTVIARQQIDSDAKWTLFRLFKKVTYRLSTATFEENEQELLAFCDEECEEFAEYYTDNWSNCVDRWAICHRIDLQTLGNNTNNRVERFYLAVKASLRVGGKSSSRHHLAESIEIVLKLVSTTNHSTKFMDYVHFNKRLHVLHCVSTYSFQLAVVNARPFDLKDFLPRGCETNAGNETLNDLLVSDEQIEDAEEGVRTSKLYDSVLSKRPTT